MAYVGAQFTHGQPLPVRRTSTVQRLLLPGNAPQCRRDPFSALPWCSWRWCQTPVARPSWSTPPVVQHSQPSASSSRVPGSKTAERQVHLAVSVRPSLRLPQFQLHTDAVESQAGRHSRCGTLTTPVYAGVPSVMRPSPDLSTWLPYRNCISADGRTHTCTRRHVQWITSARHQLTDCSTKRCESSWHPLATRRAGLSKLSTRGV